MRGRGLVAGGLVLSLIGVTAAGDVEKGKAQFMARCSFCHGPSGMGDGPAGAALKPPPTDFATVEYWKTADLDRLRTVLKSGKPGTGMPPSQLSAEEIDDVLDYLKTLARH
jgi:mono/diheme cytochrome c family protein